MVTVVFFQLEGYRSYAGVQYSPLDMAEYVFWTGDEKGVTAAIEEFLQDGLVGLIRFGVFCPCLHQYNFEPSVCNMAFG